MILEAVLYGLLLPLLAAAAVLVAVSRCGKGGRAVAASAALVVGFVVGNHFRPAAEYRIDAERPLEWGDFAAEIVHAVSGFPDETAHPPALFWLPWAAVFAAVVGLLARAPRVPAVAGHLLRALAAGFVARLLVQPSWRIELPWLWPVLAAVVLAEWALLDAFAEDGVWLPWGLGLAFLAAGAVLLHAHTARLTDLATFVAGGCLGVGLAARWAGADVRGMAPVVAVVLPGLMLVGQRSTYSDVPAMSFALAGLTPIALAPLLLPQRYRRWRPFAGLVLLVVPAGAAVFLAWWAEPLSFD